MPGNFKFFENLQIFVNFRLNTIAKNSDNYIHPNPFLCPFDTISNLKMIPSPTGNTRQAKVRWREQTGGIDTHRQKNEKLRNE